MIIGEGLLPLDRAVAALTAGPGSVLGRGRGARRPSGVSERAEADLVVFDRAARWTVGPESLRTKGFCHPLAGRSLPGQVLLTIAGGRLAYRPDAAEIS